MPALLSFKARRFFCGKAIVTVFAILLASPTFGFDYKIEGAIYLPEGWNNSIYLSAINSFDERNTASEDFIINTSIIDSSGRFSFTGKKPSGY